MAGPQPGVGLGAHTPNDRGCLLQGNVWGALGVALVIALLLDMCITTVRAELQRPHACQVLGGCGLPYQLAPPFHSDPSMQFTGTTNEFLELRKPSTGEATLLVDEGCDLTSWITDACG